MDKERLLYLSAELAHLITKLPVMRLDEGFGMAYYVWDDHAKREGSGWSAVRVLGGDTIRGRSVSGEIVEIFGRLVPGYATAWNGLGELVGAMDDLGWTGLQFRDGIPSGYEAVWSRRTGKNWAARADTRLEAAALAARAALLDREVTP